MIKNNKILIISGEASGDMHGAKLVDEIKSLDPSLTFSGIGGSELQSSGVELLYNIKDMAFLGIIEVIRHIPFIKKVEKDILEKVKNENIENAILIDYPGFNIRIAAKLKKLGVKVFYYISPQLWAWGKKRVHKVKKYVDKMIVLFPFEKEFYKQYDIDAEYVGHPLVDKLNNYNFSDKDSFYNEHKLNPDKELLLLLPGSRSQEIKKLFPVLIESANAIAIKNNLQIIVACSDNIDENVFAEFKNIEFKIIKGKTFDLFKHSKFGIIKSGTSTLEAALNELPFILIYATNKLTYMIGKLLVKIESIGLVNIVAGKIIVKELIQQEVNKKNITDCVNNYLQNQTKIEKIKSDLKIIKQKLGNAGASKKAAKIIVSELK